MAVTFGTLRVYGKLVSKFLHTIRDWFHRKSELPATTDGWLA